MQTLIPIAGTRIEDAAAMLVAHAPARATFNGIPIRARYATTRPEDIVRHFLWNLELRSITWNHSPAGVATKMRAAEAQDAAQRTIVACLERLPSLDMTDSAAVLSWVGEMTDPVYHVGVDYDHGATVAWFAAAGWLENENCNEAFDGTNAVNFAHWIVGQWLASKAPVGRFIRDWQAKFTVQA